MDYLVAEKHWPKTKSTIHATEIDFTGTREKVINHIQENDLEIKISEVVAGVWNQIEKECSVDRKSRYS